MNATYSVGLRTAVEGDVAPTDFAAPPDDSGRTFVVDQPGVVYVLRNGTLREEPFLDVRDQVVELYNYGTFWGVGTLDVNDGEQTWENRVIHFMTTQMARDSNYALGLDEEMPLDEPFLGRSHHTHGFVFPITMTPGGFQFDPLDLPFPPDGEGQPFVHIMYDRDDVSISAETRESGGNGGGG